MISAIPEWKQHALELYRAGQTYAEISREFRRSPSTVRHNLTALSSAEDRREYRELTLSHDEFAAASHVRKLLEVARMSS
jgi:predicted transcriptional regulator